MSENIDLNVGGVTKQGCVGGQLWRHGIAEISFMRNEKIRHPSKQNLFKLQYIFCYKNNVSEMLHGCVGVFLVSEKLDLCEKKCLIYLKNFLRIQ